MKMYTVVLLAIAWIKYDIIGLPRHTAENRFMSNLRDIFLSMKKKIIRPLCIAC